MLAILNNWLGGGRIREHRCTLYAVETTQLLQVHEESAEISSSITGTGKSRSSTDSAEVGDEDAVAIDSADIEEIVETEGTVVALQMQQKKEAVVGIVVVVASDVHENAQMQKTYQAMQKQWQVMPAGDKSAAAIVISAMRKNAQSASASTNTYYFN